MSLPPKKPNADQGSQVDNDVLNGLRATHEKVALGGFVEWLGSVDDRSRNQSAFPAVTDHGPARPTDRDVAGLGQLQKALVGRGVPVRGDATARERYQRTGAGVGVGVVFGKVRGSRASADDAGGHRLAAVEDFDMNPLRRHA